MRKQNTIDQARERAQANADHFRKPYCVFFDANGNARCERFSTQQPEGLFEVYRPADPFRTEFDTLDSSSLGALFEISIRTDIGDQRKVILEASSKSEAEEIFFSLPGTRGCRIEDLRRVLHGIYWVND